MFCSHTENQNIEINTNMFLDNFMVFEISLVVQVLNLHSLSLCLSIQIGDLNCNSILKTHLKAIDGFYLLM